MTTYEPLLTSRTVSVAIERSPRDVYAFVRTPANLLRWAAGLAQSIEERDGVWHLRMPSGATGTLRFAPDNAFGVLDHEVALDNGETTNNPMRVVPNGGGSELLFTLFQRRSVRDSEFARDAASVKRDLEALRDLLEAEM